MTHDDKTPREEVQPEAGDDALPEGVPEPPDLEKVRDLRHRMEEDRARKSGPVRVGTDRRGVTLDEDTGRRARDIGLYTVIPMMLLAGPAIGYLVGYYIERVWGGTPWPTVVGALFGLAAAFRQIYLLLARKAAEDAGKRRS